MGFGSGRQLGKFICRWCGGEFEGDVRNVCCRDPECQQKESDSIRRQKYEATKKRIHRTVENPCRICGHDKGHNRWYCRECLNAISAGALFD